MRTLLSVVASLMPDIAVAHRGCRVVMVRASSKADGRPTSAKRPPQITEGIVSNAIACAVRGAR